MNDRIGQAQRLGRRIDAGWGLEDVEAQLAALRTRQQRRSRRRALTVPLACGALAVAIAMAAWGRQDVRSPAVTGREAVVGPMHQPAHQPSHPIEREKLPVASPVAAAPREPEVPPGAHPLGDGSRGMPPAKDSRLAARAMSDPPATIPEPTRTWREDADRGDYEAAWAALARSSAPIVGMEDLLLVGDVARLSGHADAAVASLTRAVALHPADPRAPLAAFTLGRVQLENLGAPRAAAVAFARARELAPDGPLAEDALAREVEAWSRCGETATARQRALSYGRQYPDGRRARAVRRFGGLEGP